MITQKELLAISKELKMNETVVLREYAQVWFLSRLYSQKNTDKLFFKGGTAIRLIFKGTRFSEDLDFTTMLSNEETIEIINKAVVLSSKEMAVTVEQNKGLNELSFRLKIHSSSITIPVFIRLDISKREKIIEPEKTVIVTPYPILFNQFVHHPSKNEIVAEKIRALVTRTKGRDLYDLWFLFQNGANIKIELVNEKLLFYKTNYDKNTLLERLEAFPKKDFVADLSPFVPSSERIQLSEFYDVVTTSIREEIS